MDGIWQLEDIDRDNGRWNGENVRGEGGLLYISGQFICPIRASTPRNAYNDA
jgi:hypothetical protein